MVSSKKPPLREGMSFSSTKAKTRSAWCGPAYRALLAGVVVSQLGDGPVATRAQDSAEDPCANAPMRFQTWPADHNEPEFPSTYSPPSDLPSLSFVVLADARTASNSLDNALNRKRATRPYEQNPYVQMEPEVFHPHGVTGQFYKVGGWTPERRDANRTEFMRLLFELDQSPGVPGAKARGFKIFSTHLSEEELVLLTRPKHVLKIVLRRQDTLSQYVSGLRAGEVGVWGAPSNAGRNGTAMAAAFADVKVPVCVAAYEAWLAAQSSWYDWLAEEAKEHPESWFFISTEKLVSDPYTLGAIYNLLKVPLGEMLEYKPYTTDVLEEKVTNYDDIKDIPRTTNNMW